MFIGEKEVKVILENPEKPGFSDIEFEDGYKTLINTELLKNISTEEKANGTITDLTGFYLAKKFLAEMASLGLEYYMVQTVGVAMDNLSHNLREELLGKTFECSGAPTIKLDKIF